MKNLLILSLLFACMPCFSQPYYPFTQGFSTAPVGEVPPGWGGTADVANGRGANGGNALSVDFYTYPASAYSITPLIGPLTSVSALSFSYRILNQNEGPFSGATVYGPGDTFKVEISANGGIYQTVFELNDSNQTPDPEFLQQNVVLDQFAGDTIRIQFVYIFGGNNSGYYFDIDTVFVEDNPGAGISPVPEAQQLALFPNPASSGTGCSLQVARAGPSKTEVFDAVGRKIYAAEFNENCRLPVGNWPPGIYFVQVENGSGTSTRKLVVE